MLYSELLIFTLLLCCWQIDTDLTRQCAGYLYSCICTSIVGGVLVFDWIDSSMPDVPRAWVPEPRSFKNKNDSKENWWFSPQSKLKQLFSSAPPLSVEHIGWSYKNDISSLNSGVVVSMCRAISGRGWIQPHPHYVRILGDSPHQIPAQLCTCAQRRRNGCPFCCCACR